MSPSGEKSPLVEHYYIKSFTRSLKCRKELQVTYVRTCYRNSLKHFTYNIWPVQTFIHCLLYLDPLPHQLDDLTICSFSFCPRGEIHEKRRKPQFKNSVILLETTWKRHGQNSWAPNIVYGINMAGSVLVIFHVMYTLTCFSNLWLLEWFV